MVPGSRLSFGNLASSLRALLATVLALGDPGALARPDRSAPADQVDWKLFFNQAFVLEIMKEGRGQGLSPEDQLAILREHVGYTPMTFNQVIDAVLRKNSSGEAYEERHGIYFNEQNLKALVGGKLDAAVPASLRQKPAVAAFLAELNRSKDRTIPSGENFFNSPEGRAVVHHISRRDTEPVLFVLVPGYAAHTIKFEIFPEILTDINTFYGRSASRRLLDEGRTGFDLRYESPQEFYGATPPVRFDIVHPAGQELGNTVGLNAETADLLAKWIEDLPPSYAQRKLILLGYSKGAPIILEMLQRHPALKSRVAGIVTFAGVVQGTHVARDGERQIRDILGPRSVGELIDKIRGKGLGETVNSLLPFVAPLDLGLSKTDRIKEALAVYGYDTSDLSAKIDRLLTGREVREVLDGIVDLSPFTRTLWNLKYLQDDLVAPGTFVLNSSAVTDISSFASRMVSRSQRRRDTALIGPKLLPDGRMGWKDLSLDAWFLYVSSMTGFKLAPGGLYDTQVDLQHTKTPWLDESPLQASLTDDELQNLWDDPLVRARAKEAGVTSLDRFKSIPRADLMAGGRLKGLKSYDLGEFKGHHWSLFHQAFRPPESTSKNFAVWDFPRKAYMRALLQTMALYRTIGSP